MTGIELGCVIGLPAVVVGLICLVYGYQEGYTAGFRDCFNRKDK